MKDSQELQTIDIVRKFVIQWTQQG